MATALLALAGARAASIDDAFIVLVYARHLLTSGRCYWNLEEGAIDGFTSPLDLIARTAGVGLAPGDPVLASWWISVGGLVLCASAGLWVCLQIARGAEEKPPRAAVGLGVLGGLAIAGTPALATATAFLLEGPLAVLLTLALLGCLLSAPRTWASVVLLALACALVPLARPEGLALAALAAAAHWSGRRGELDVARRLFPGLLAAGALGFYGIWHLRTFGALAPNTYYAKRSASLLWELRDGFEYVWYHDAQPLLAVQLLAAALAPLLLWRRLGLPDRARRQCGLLVPASVLALGVVVIAGGDGYVGGRFLALPAVLGTLILVAAAAHLSGLRRAVPIAALVLVGGGQLVHALVELRPRLQRIAREWPLRERHFARDRRVARQLSSGLPGTRVAQSDYQRFKYFADGTRVHDLHGLNDRRIAHEPVPGQVDFGKYRHAHGLRADAEIWIYGVQPFARVPMARFPLSQVLGDPGVYRRLVGYGASPAEAQAITARYLPASLPIDGEYFNFLVRRDVAPRAAAAGAVVGTP